MKWMNLLLFLFLFLLLRMHFITKTKGIELCHFPWALVKMFVTQDDILMSNWRLSSCLFLPSCWFFFHFFTFFPCTKYHKLVWFAYRWRNFFQNATLLFFLQSSLLILVMSPITSYGLRLSLSSLLMLWQKALFLLLQKDLRVRDFIS